MALEVVREFMFTPAPYPDSLCTLAGYCTDLIDD
jgi:hypothetical protein